MGVSVHTRDPKSEWAPMPTTGSLPDGLGEVLIRRASLPLNSSSLCLSVMAPAGNPNFSSKIWKRVVLTSRDLRTNGVIVDSMRALTVEG